MTSPQEERTTFGKISELYESARPSYPPALIMDILSFSKLPKKGKVLDVGCGTGQATVLFAEKGFSVTGLDPSKEMVAAAKKKCGSFPKSKFITGFFEEASLSEDYFDLIISGMAWHWVASEGRYEKVHKILKKEGSLAFFWYHQVDNKSLFLKDAGTILDKYGGKKSGPAGARITVSADAVFEGLTKNTLFTAVTKKEYFETIEFSKERYLHLVLTYGWV